MIPWPIPDDRLFEVLYLLAELQLQTEGADNTNIELGAKIRVAGLARPREVDVLVEGDLGGRQFRRIVEVQKRRRKVNQQFIDAMVGKMREVKAHRGTIVSEAGFTSDALSRIAADSTLDAIHLREPDLSKWPVISGELPVTVSYAGGSERIAAKPYAVAELVEARERHLVLIGISEATRSVIGLVIEARVGEGGRRQGSVFILGNGETEIRASVDVSAADGSSYSISGKPRRERLIPVGRHVS